MILITTLRKKPASLEHETSPERNTNSIEYIQQIHCKYQNLLFWDTYWTSTKTICGIETTFLWNVLTGTNSSWEWTFTITTSTKNRICKSTTSKRRTGTQSINITIKSSWYWNRTWQYYSGNFSNDTFNIKKFITTTSYMIWIFRSYTIPQSYFDRKTKTSICYRC